MKQYPKVGVAVIIIKNNKVLLGKRFGSHGEGTWQFPGGHLEFNESLENCAKREVSEEVGLEIANVRFGALTNDIFHQENKHYITIFMVADYLDGQPQNLEPQKSREWDWFEWSKFPKEIFLPIRNLQKQNFSPFKDKKF